MTVSEAESLLAEHAYFDESILLGVWTSNLLRDYHAIVSVARNELGELREDFGHNFLMLVFGFCQRVNVHNAFTAEELGDRANWGLNEFAFLRVSQAEDGLLAFRFSWEDDRHVEIVCASVRAVTDEAEIREACGHWLEDARSVLR